MIVVSKAFIDTMNIAVKNSSSIEELYEKMANFVDEWEDDDSNSDYRMLLDLWATLEDIINHIE